VSELGVGLAQTSNYRPKPTGKTGASMGNYVLFVPFLLIMGGLVWRASRRQRSAMQATIDLHDSLQPGDRVHTTSGLQATVVAITDDTVDLEISPGVVTTWMKLAIRDEDLDDSAAPDDQSRITERDT
jgi:preprotein translocase subunit YajC